MNVLMVEPYMGIYGGSATVVYNLAKYLIKHDVRTTVLSLTSGKEYEGIEIILPPSHKQIPYHIRSGNFSSLLEIYQMIRILNDLIKKYIDDFDIVNTHNTPAVWATPFTKKPVIWMCNEIPDFWHTYKINKIINRIADIGRFIDKKIANKKVSDAVVADETNARRFAYRYGWQPKIIQYGIESDFFTKKVNITEKEALRHKFGIDNNSFYIVHAAMVSPSKKQMDLLEAFRRIKDRFKEVKVIFVGLYEESYYKKLIESFIREHDLKQRVIFTGHISKEELRAIYSISHMAVFPGLGQGSWLGPFEALCTGKPIIVSSALPCSDLISKQNIGIVSDELVEAITEVYNNYNRHLKRSVQGKNYVLKNITYENFGEKFLNIFKKHL